MKDTVTTAQMKAIASALASVQQASNEALETILSIGRANPDLTGFTLRCAISDILRTSSLRNSTSWAIGTEAIARLLEYERGERSGAV